MKWSVSDLNHISGSIQTDDGAQIGEEGEQFGDFASAAADVQRAAGDRNLWDVFEVLNE